MKMDKFCAGLVALVAGLALSAGNASATAGYTSGDPAMMKLVPYYETGATRATIIGVQNLSELEASTVARHQAVADAMTALADNDATTDLDTVATEEMALADAEAAVYTEHIFVDVDVFDAMGMMMGEATLCLADHQFGYVILQGPTMQASQATPGLRGQILSVDDGDISPYGYVEIMAEGTKYESCTPESGRTGRGFVAVLTAGSETGITTDDVSTGAKSMIAAWTIIQDVGDGFFGTEVPTATISKSMVPGVIAGDDLATQPAIAAGDPMMACYSGDGTPSTRSSDDVTMTAGDGVASNMTNAFMMSRCGLIPERHNNTRNAMGVLDTTTSSTADNRNADSATPRANGVARYDAMDETMVVVWLAEGMDDPEGHASDDRMLDVLVKCEDGTVMGGVDQYGDPTPTIKVAAPGNLTMIDPTMGAVGDATDMCEGDRGVLRITMPNGSHAGMVFSHITQMMGHYRMNFAGYSKANPMTCFEMGVANADADATPPVTAEAAAITACM